MEFLDKKELKHILSKYDNNNFYLQVTPCDKLKLDDSLDANFILECAFSTSFDVATQDGFVVLARQKSKNKDEEDYVIGVGLVVNDRSIDFYNNENLFKEFPELNSCKLKETYIANIATIDSFRGLDKNTNHNEKRAIKGVGTSILSCIKDLSHAMGKDAVTLFSKPSRTLKKFYNHRNLKETADCTFIRFNNLELNSIGRINATIIKEMLKQKIKSYDEFVDKNKDNRLFNYEHDKGYENYPDGVIKEMMSPINKDATTSAKRFLNLNKRVIEELVEEPRDFEYNDPFMTAGEKYEELLVLNKDIKNGFKANYMGSKLPRYSAHYLLEKYGDKNLPIRYENNIYLYKENTVAREMNSHELDLMIKVLKSTEANYAQMCIQEKGM
ncbi:MAG: hypothetical protein IK070_00115 [Clostridia bacterium]|nr:hypothetical protein [Clostridia bacterium]